MPKEAPQFKYDLSPHLRSIEGNSQLLQGDTSEFEKYLAETTGEVLSHSAKWAMDNHALAFEMLYYLLPEDLLSKIDRVHFIFQHGSEVVMVQKYLDQTGQNVISRFVPRATYAASKIASKDNLTFTRFVLEPGKLTKEN